MIHVDDRARPDRPFAMLHARNEAAWSQAAASLRAAITLSDTRPAARPLMRERLATRL
jgi:thymidine phosphorylase